MYAHIAGRRGLASAQGQADDVQAYQETAPIHPAQGREHSACPPPAQGRARALCQVYIHIYEPNSVLLVLLLVHLLVHLLLVLFVR